MEQVNKEKKFFAKVNIVDITLVIFLILIMFILYNMIFPLKAFKKLHDVPGQKWMSVEIIVPEDKDWMYKYIQKGDKQKGLSDKVFGEVIDKYYSQEFDEKRRLTVKLRILASLEPGQYPLMFGRHPVTIGEPIVFQTENYILNGYIAKIEDTK